MVSCNTENQIANIFTKTLGREKFEEKQDKVGTDEAKLNTCYFSSFSKYGYDLVSQYLG